MPRDPQPRRGSAPVPATPISALAVAVLAADPATSATHQVFLLATVVIAVLAVVCDALAWRLERDQPRATAHL